MYLEKYEAKEINSVKKHSPNRSTPQNNLYWLWLTHSGNEIGEDPEVLNVTFKSDVSC